MLIKASLATIHINTAGVIKIPVAIIFIPSVIFDHIATIAPADIVTSDVATAKLASISMKSPPKRLYMCYAVSVSYLIS